MHLALDSQDLTPEEVGERFRWAVRQGSPAWLWPETSPGAWREALARIEAAARLILGSDGAVATLEGDPVSLGVAGYTSGMGPLLGCWIEQGRLDASAEACALFGLHLSHNRLRAARLEPQSGRVVKALGARGIEVVVLKGGHTASHYFPEPGARPRSDLDLLIRRERRPEAEATLARLGFVEILRLAHEGSWRPSESASLPRSLGFVHADDPWSVDLHVSIDVSPGPGAARARLDSAKPFGGRGRWAEDRRARILDQPLLLLYLAAHAGAGLHNLSLIRLVESILVIRRDLAGGSLSWPHFVDLGTSTDALGLCFPTLALAEALVPGTVPDWVIATAAAAAPATVRRVVAGLGPATAQRVDRTSLAEHFMWSSGWRGLARRIASDALPSLSLRQAWSIYERRAWRLLRGTISR